MKRSGVTWTMVCFLLLALMLIGIGILWGLETFSRFEQIAMLHEDHEQLLHSIQAAAFSLLLLGSMVVAGIGILVILFLQLIHKTSRIQKEAACLRQRNEAMEELNRKTQQLAHHQRLETIGTLTSSIAHEFNNLLTPIMGYSLMALEKLPPEEELYDEILEVYNASRKAKTIISRLNDLSRKNSDMSFRILSLDSVVQKTLEVAAPAKPRKVEVQVNLNCWDQALRANEIQLSQLLLNLILNSFHAMEEEGGVLTIATSFDEKNIHLRISDTGCGIPAEVLPRIFEPFFTTKESGKGTGLGLAIAAQVVEDHHGKIQVDSREGEGTSFHVLLPRTPAAQAQTD